GLRIVGIKRGDGGVLAAGDGHDIAGDISVVRGFAIARGQPPPGGIDQRRDHDDQAEPEKTLAAYLGPLRACCGDIAHRLTSWAGARPSRTGSKPPPTASSKAMRWLAARVIRTAICWRAESKVASAASMGICSDRPRR